MRPALKLAKQLDFEGGKKTGLLALPKMII
jgi:hypothetical protein